MLRPLLVVTACVLARDVVAQAPMPFDTLKARALLDRRLPCLGCHPLGGVGGRVGPDLATVRARRDAQYIADMVDDPQRRVPGSAMPRAPLPPTMRTTLLRYLTGAVSVPARRVEAGVSPPSTTDAIDGAALYARWCASCHGARGAGDGPNARFLPVPPAVHADARAMSRRTDDQLHDIVSAGGAPMGRSARMPAFGATLAPAEIRALVRHIRALCACQAAAQVPASRDATTP